MMQMTVRKNGDQSADFELPEGCILCGQTLTVRVSPAGAYSVCPRCRWIAHPQVRMGQGGVEVAYSAVAQA